MLRFRQLEWSTNRQIDNWNIFFSVKIWKIRQIRRIPLLPNFVFAKFTKDFKFRLKVFYFIWTIKKLLPNPLMEWMLTLIIHFSKQRFLTFNRFKRVETIGAWGEKNIYISLFDNACQWKECVRFQSFLNCIKCDIILQGSRAPGLLNIWNEWWCEMMIMFKSITLFVLQIVFTNKCMSINICQFCKIIESSHILFCLIELLDHLTHIYY